MYQFDSIVEQVQDGSSIKYTIRLVKVIAEPTKIIHMTLPLLANVEQAVADYCANVPEDAE